MKKLISGFVFLFAAVFLMAYTASAQSFLVGPKGEKKWMESFYRANGVAPAPKPSELRSGGIGFTFTSTPDVAGFNTSHPAYNGAFLGDLTGETVSADITITASGPFTYYGQGTPGNPCGTPATARLYFETNNNSLGESQYWWSYSAGSSYALAPGSATLEASLHPSSWSDRDGHTATFDSAHTAAFAAAVSDVQLIGLSFGGGCFYANGVGSPNGDATFTLNDFDVD
jgi:hypothetical protein